VTLIALLLLGAAAEYARAADEGRSLDATIRRDSHGIPHILADDLGGIGFGYGYAFAEDNICTIAESYVTVGAERSRYFGPDAGYEQNGNGFDVDSNLNSDFFYQRIIDDGVIEGLLAKAPPLGPREEVKEGVRGYVAGYNQYLAETGVPNLPDPRCRGADWVKPIEPIDAYRRFYQLALLASGTVAIDGIGSSQPPALGAPTPPLDPTGIAEGLEGALGSLPIGSNGVGLGSEATDNGKGMLLGNPHFPWDGPERLYHSHLTIPGELNVSGGSLYGVPLVLIGHTDNLAWSHTVSTAYRFTPFQEVVNPADPTQYLYDGQFRDMEADEVTVMAKAAGGGLEPRTRTLYSTHHGPIVSELSGIPLPWTPVLAFSMGDANATNFRYLNHFFETNQAQSTDELDAVLKRNQGVPWVNTIAADSRGKAYYADISVVPNVSDDKAQTCNTPVGLATYQLLRLPILDGTRSDCEWGADSDAVEPGIFGPSKLPSQTRDDYTSNMNDSFWLSNPEDPIEGYAQIIGDERTPRSLRTRLGLKIIQQRLDGSDGLPGNRFTRQQLQDAVFNNRQYAGELFRDQLVTLCENAPGGTLLDPGDPTATPPQAPEVVDVSDACPVLAAWDLHDDLDSNGAILFRRFASRLLANPGGLPVGLPLPTGDLTIFTTPFDVSDPVNTPSGLNPVKAAVALAAGVDDLNDAGIPLDAPLRGWQYEKRGDDRIPIHGGPGTLGVFNAINVGWSAGGAEPGYPNVPHGSSFVMVTQFTDGCPDDRSIVTYSQSENPSSSHAGDQTRMFSRKEWVDPAFCESEVLAEPGLVTTPIEGCMPEGCGATAPGPGTDPVAPGSTAKPKGKAKKRCKPKRGKRGKRSPRKGCKRKR
jgi:acyl-homoserine-lactone acylase